MIVVMVVVPSVLGFDTWSPHLDFVGQFFDGDFAMVNFDCQAEYGI